MPRLPGLPAIQQLRDSHAAGVGMLLGLVVHGHKPQDRCCRNTTKATLYAKFGVVHVLKLQAAGAQMSGGGEHAQAPQLLNS